MTRRNNWRRRSKDRASVLGSVLGLTIIAIKRGNMKYALPFGTFLALGALAASLVGEQIVTWYAAQLG